jgi:hypothetical protein
MDAASGARSKATRITSSAIDLPEERDSATVRQRTSNEGPLWSRTCRDPARKRQGHYTSTTLKVKTWSPIAEAGHLLHWPTWFSTQNAYVISAGIALAHAIRSPRTGDIDDIATSR